MPIQNIYDYENHFKDHIMFLNSSAISYDNGFEGEAKRMATSIRVLLHDTNQSKSLLGQLSIKEKLYYLDTAEDYPRTNLASFMGLLSIKMSVNNNEFSNPSYEPLCYSEDDIDSKSEWKTFDSWWNKIVFCDIHKNKFSRRSIILKVANEDGGAHVDPNLNEAYAKLSRQNSLEWYDNNGNSPKKSPVFASIRQITYELIKTFTNNSCIEKQFSELLK